MSSEDAVRATDDVRRRLPAAEGAMSSETSLAGAGGLTGAREDATPTMAGPEVVNENGSVTRSERGGRMSVVPSEVSDAIAGAAPVGLGVSSRTNPRADSMRQVPGRLVSNVVFVV